MKEYIAVIATATLVIAILIYSNSKTIIMKQAEMLAALEEADQATNEIAADIQVLIDQGAVSEEVAAKLTAHVDKLKGIAAER